MAQIQKITNHGVKCLCNSIIKVTITQNIAHTEFSVTLMVTFNDNNPEVLKKSLFTQYRYIHLHWYLGTII